MPYTLGLATICWATWKTRKPIENLCYACALMQYWTRLYSKGGSREATRRGESVKRHAAGGIKTAGESIKHGSGDPANWGEEGWDWEDLAASCLPWIDVARLGSRSPAFLAFCKRICWECMLSPGRLWCFCFILQMVEVILVSLPLRLCLTAWVQLGT